MIRHFSIILGTVLLAGCLATGGPEADLLFLGGTVIDGTGTPARVADVAVRDGRIAAVGDLDGWGADRTLDVSGLAIAPGFVDMHGHADLVLLSGRSDLLSAKIRQGVTTIVVGNCGLGVAPASGGASAILGGINAWMTPHGAGAADLSIGAYLDRLESAGVPLNVGTLVPHGPVRISVMGLAPGTASPGDLRAMREAVARGLDEGAFGLSVGLIYPPGMFSPTGELIALAREVAERDALFTAHVRGSSETLLPATDELIAIARGSGARVHHSHLEAVGEPFWPRIVDVLAREDEARREGVAITHEVFPYTRAATMLSAIFPPWSLEGGVPALLSRLRDPAARSRIRRDIAEHAPGWPPWDEGGWPHNLVRAVGWDGILVGGKSVREIANAEGKDPFDVVADRMLAHDGQVGQLVDEISGLDAIATILSHPEAVVVSDAEDYGREAPHPAHAGAFARALAMARDLDVTPEDMIRKMTSLPASLLRIEGRGTIETGAFADLVVLDLERVTDRASWVEPRAPAAGIPFVVINGQIVVENGEHVERNAGRVLRTSRAHAPSPEESRDRSSTSP